MKSDTIAAIATAMTNSGIGIIRISGPDAFTIIDRIYLSKNGRKKLSKEKTHTIHYGYIKEKEEIIDEALVLIFRAPHTYTTEDIIEIDCHGGVLIMQRILDLVIKNGARLAEPGEFTKRAFLNGRIDLSQAEAVVELINSKNEYARRASINQLSGKNSKRIKDIREEILYEIAYIESALDDPEHISLDGYSAELLVKAQSILSAIEELLNVSDNGRILFEGIQTVILGKPNVGKSSLLNLLAGEERAIVTEIAGTTRDVLSENIQLGGISLNILDTAGIRKTDDIVERIGVERAKSSADEADLIIFIIDSSRDLDENDKEIFSFIENKTAIILLNKTDLKGRIKIEDIKKLTDKIIIPISAKESIGIQELEKTIKDLFIAKGIEYNDQVFITNARQKASLIEAQESMKCVIDSIQQHLPEDFFTIDLMNAYEQLGYIVGETIEDDLINEIFHKFCMGK